MKHSIIISGNINSKLVRQIWEELRETDAGDISEIEVYINSQGGHEHCGRAIAGTLRSLANQGCKITTHGYGDIHSAAVIIFAAGDNRVLSRFSNVMVHESSAEVSGNSTAIKKHAKQMEADEKFWCELLQELTGTDSKTWLKLHENETFLTPQEALNLNLATEII